MPSAVDVTFFAQVRERLARGGDVALATIIAREGTGPRDPGAMFAVGSDGTLLGALSSGCLEAAIVDEARDVLRGGTARIRTYGPEGEALDDRTFGALTCGGSVAVLIERLERNLWDAFAAAAEAGRPVAWARALDCGTAVVEPHQTMGNFQPRRLFAKVIDLAHTMLTAHGSGVTRIDCIDGCDGPLIVQTVAARPLLVVVGAVDFAAATLDVGRLLGFACVLLDARPAFVTALRFPQADRIEVGWPHETFTRLGPDDRTAVVVLTHDEKFDVPFLKVALSSPAYYVGALGSRRTNDRRLEALRACGVDEAMLARLHAPIGLDIGARAPAEVAVAIGAEIVAARNQRSGGLLRDADGPIGGRHSLVSA